jgi:hypothetical protein
MKPIVAVALDAAYRPSGAVSVGAVRLEPYPPGFEIRGLCSAAKELRTGLAGDVTRRICFQCPGAARFSWQLPYRYAQGVRCERDALRVHREGRASAGCSCSPSRTSVW